MRRQVAIVSGIGVSNPLIMDDYISPFNVGFGVVVTGSVVYTVQHTFDDVFSTTYVPASGNWFNHPTIIGATISQDGNYAFPVSAIRLNLTSGTGSINGVFIQAGLVGG